MRASLVLLVAACSFHHGEEPVVRDTAAISDTAADTRPAMCGNGVVEAGEACEVGQTAACTTSCGDVGTRTCNASCGFDDCVVAIDPATAWQSSADGAQWTSTALLSTSWGCTNCSRYFRTTVCDAPSAVEFQWASDNKARMQVAGTYVFTEFWLTSYCTDEPCCTKCCDTTPNCLANTSAVHVLPASALALFHAGANQLRWEVFQEVGGSGFYTTMTVRYHSP